MNRWVTVVCLLLCVLMAVPAMDALTQEGIKVRQQASDTEGQFSINYRVIYGEGQAVGEIWCGYVNPQHLP